MIYDKYKKSKYWILIDEELKALEKNQDISITTSRDLVIGAIVKKIIETKSVKLEKISKR